MKLNVHLFISGINWQTGETQIVQPGLNYVTIEPSTTLPKILQHIIKGAVQHPYPNWLSPTLIDAMLDEDEIHLVYGINIPLETKLNDGFWWEKEYEVYRQLTNEHIKNSLSSYSRITKFHV